MDQRKTSLPYDSVEQMSAADTGNRIPQHVMGGIIHGIGKYFYVSDGHLSDLKGGDFGECCNIIWITLTYIIFLLYNKAQNNKFRLNFGKFS